MTESYELFTTYKVKYTNENPVPVDEIVESLKSLERLLKRTPDFLEKAYDGIEITGMEVYITSIESGSLIEEFAIKYIFKGQDNYDNAKAVVDKMLEDNEVVRVIVAAGVGAVLTFGLLSAIGSSSSTPNIKAYDNTIINIGGEVSLDSADITAVLNGITDRKTLAKQAVSAVSPAKLDKNATIEINDNPMMTISSAFIEEAPDEYSPPVPDELEEHYSGMMVTIYASDRDSKEKGWAGALPQLFNKRVKFTLSDDVDPTEVHGRTNLRANVIVNKRFVKSKKGYEVKSVEIAAILPNEIRPGSTM